MKKLLLTFVFALGIFAIAQAARKPKKDLAPPKSKTTVVSKKVLPLPVILVVTEGCCDGTSRSTILYFFPTEPPADLIFGQINDPKGDCPICPPQ